MTITVGVLVSNNSQPQTSDILTRAEEKYILAAFPLAIKLGKLELQN